MLSFFPRDVFDKIWDLIGSVFEGFSSYSFTLILTGPRFISIFVFRSKERISSVTGKIRYTFPLKRPLNTQLNVAKE